MEGYGYLEAWCYSASALRTFRLDRIAAVEVTDIDVAPHDVVLKDLSTGWFETLKDAPLVVLELARKLRGWLEYYPDGNVNRDDSGRQTVGLRVTDPAWLRGCCCGWRVAPACCHPWAPVIWRRRPGKRSISTTRFSAADGHPPASVR